MNKVIQLGHAIKTGHRNNPNRFRLYDTSGIAPTIDLSGGGGRGVYIVRLIKYDRPKVQGNIAKDI